MGYGEIANYIKRKTYVDTNTNLSSKQQKQQEISLIRSLFNNRLVIIDEVHNIRVMQVNKEAKRTATLLMRCCKYADNIRLLLLSATPIFNNQREIIWLTNLLNVVDKRSLIEESDVFTNEGTMVEPKTLEDGTVIEEDGGTGDSTDWKWAEQEGFYDKDWLSIDEDELFPDTYVDEEVV